MAQPGRSQDSHLHGLLDAADAAGGLLHGPLLVDRQPGVPLPHRGLHPDAQGIHARHHHGECLPAQGECPQPGRGWVGAAAEGVNQFQSASKVPGLDHPQAKPVRRRISSEAARTSAAQHLANCSLPGLPVHGPLGRPHIQDDPFCAAYC
eukprot:scaffold45963_cov20-Tisochrysis_lutea.AAC.1